MNNRIPASTPDFSLMNAFAWWPALLESLSPRLPGSGNLKNNQDIATSLVRSAGDQLGLINISTVESKDPGLERNITKDVAGYGRQLGWIIDALDVVIKKHLEAPSPDEEKALAQFRTLSEKIVEVKERTARERCDRMVADILALKEDPVTNHQELSRLREALGQVKPA